MTAVEGVAPAPCLTTSNQPGVWAPPTSCQPSTAVDPPACRSNEQTNHRRRIRFVNTSQPAEVEESFSTTTRMLNTDCSCTGGILTGWFVEWSLLPLRQDGRFGAWGPSSSFMERQVDAEWLLWTGDCRSSKGLQWAAVDCFAFQREVKRKKTTRCDEAIVLSFSHRSCMTCWSWSKPTSFNKRAFFFQGAARFPKPAPWCSVISHSLFSYFAFCGLFFDVHWCAHCLAVGHWEMWRKFPLVLKTGLAKLCFFLHAYDSKRFCNNIICREMIGFIDLQCGHKWTGAVQQFIFNHY